MPNSKPKKPYVLIILDGWGLAARTRGNAIAQAETPNIDEFWANFPHTKLCAIGKCVGLSANEMGGSEAGHLNLGTGRIVKQDSEYISDAIKSRKFFKNPVLRRAINHVNVLKSKLHLMGLLSSKDSPHSDPRHLEALLELAKSQKVKKVFLHLFTDGRDTLPRSALKYLKKLKATLKKIGLGQIASIGGRYYAMDRTKNWPRLYKAYEAIANGKGEEALGPEEAIKNAYQKGLKDEFILPTVIVDEEGVPKAKVETNDSVIFFNLRSDRARQFSKLFVLDKVDSIRRKFPKPKNLFFVAMTDFGPDLPAQTAYLSHDVRRTLPWILRDLKQLYIAETEKYAHITYFFNGGYAKPVGGENRICIASPKVSSYDQTPEMSAGEITDIVVKNIKNNVYDFTAINLANGDMVGHTGNLAAGIRAVEFVDRCVGKIVDAVLRKRGVAFITADHGNIDEMIDLKTGKALTMHSKNPVPFIVVDGYKVRTKFRLRNNGVLGDVAPTILDFMGIKRPKEMVRSSLIKS